jgi:MoaE-MoaD fusion protein
MNRLTIRLFATLRERAGAPELTRDFPDDATVAQIWTRLKAEFPALEGHRDAVRFAVNQEYVDDDYRPRPNDEIAFIPPVSGGSDAPPWIGPIKIVHDRVDVAALEAAVADPLAGAICTFFGTTRENNVGRKVLRLEYEA